MEKELMNDEKIREIKILEFQVGGYSYGVDINDVREIMPFDKNQRKIPNANPYIEGIIKPRNFIIAIIDLASYLKVEKLYSDEHDMIIVSSINDMNIGFHVDSVERIYKIYSFNVMEPIGRLSTPVKRAVKGIVNIDNRRIELLELRNIISDINPNIKF